MRGEAVNCEDEIRAREPSDELRAALDVPFTFDMLRDPIWKPSREDYRSIRDNLAGRVRELEEALRDVRLLILALDDARTPTEHDRSYRACIAKIDAALTPKEPKP